MEEAIDWLNSFPKDYDDLVFENIQLQAGNVQTFQVLAQLQGCIMIYAMKKKKPYTIYGSTSWKSTCGVKGRKRTEQKANAHAFAEKQYGISPLLSQDAVDAICIAHHHIEQIKKTV